MTSHHHPHLTKIVLYICSILIGLSVFYVAIPKRAYAEPVKLKDFIINQEIITGAAGSDVGKVYATVVENNLFKALQDEIEKEEGKSVDQFFVIKKCLEPCLKSPSTCYGDMDDYYQESIFKLTRASVLLDNLMFTISLQGGFKIKNGSQIDWNSLSVMLTLGIVNTIYSLVNFNDIEKFNQFTKPIVELSPVGRKIFNSNLDFKSKQRLIAIWLMRQVPYAVEDVFRKWNSNGININIKDFDQKVIDDKTINYLNNLIYDSKPAKIDWNKYTQQKQITSVKANEKSANNKAEITSVKALGEKAEKSITNGSTAQRYGIKYIREITYKGKSTPSWIILKDSKGRYCAIITSSKYPVLEYSHYCIPFSGNDKDLKDSFAGNRIAEIDFPDHKKCKNVEFVSDNEYCNRFNKAFEEMAQKEQLLSVTDICRNDPDLDNDFWSHICEHLELEHDLD